MNIRTTLIAFACTVSAVACDFSSTSKLICNGKEQVVGPKSVETIEVKNVIATLHKSLIGSSKNIEVRTQSVGWIDAAYCYPSNQGDYFRGSGCNDYEVMIELDKQNGRLFIHRAPYRHENSVVATDKHIVAEYFCKNAEPIR